MSKMTNILSLILDTSSTKSKVGLLNYAIYVLKLSYKMASTFSSTNNCSIINLHNTRLFFNKQNSRTKLNFKVFRVPASSDNPEDCNVEECAPDKEVGKISMEWVAEERTKVVGTYPPRKKSWSGYVEKDTAGQTNIYSVEPAVYVAESAISSGTAGSSSDGAENTAAIAAFIGLISVAAAASILLQVGKNPSPPLVQTTEYSGPSLSYYIDKFKPPEIIQASVPTETETLPSETATSAPTLLESSTSDAGETEISGPTLQESSAPDAPEVLVPADTQLDAPIESIS